MMDLMTLKRAMAEVYAAIASKAEEGELPAENEVGQFVRMCRQMHLQAPDKWLGEAEDFLHLAAQLQQAVKYRHLEEVIILVDSLNDAQSYCHRIFKK